MSRTWRRGPGNSWRMGDEYEQNTEQIKKELIKYSLKFTCSKNKTKEQENN